MKGDAEVIAMLNELLADELTAINQYMLHAEICGYYGYQGLHEAIEKQAIDEMRHAEWLMERILFLEGAPIVNQLKPMKIGKQVDEIIANDLQLERGAVEAYGRGVALAGDKGDQATADLLVKILGMEEEHVAWGERQLRQIEQVGLQNYLSAQIGGEG
jgi:bacterioferritin